MNTCASLLKMTVAVEVTHQVLSGSRRIMLTAELRRLSSQYIDKKQQSGWLKSHVRYEILLVQETHLALEEEALSTLWRSGIQQLGTREAKLRQELPHCGGQPAN